MDEQVQPQSFKAEVVCPECNSVIFVDFEASDLGRLGIVTCGDCDEDFAVRFTVSVQVYQLQPVALTAREA